MLIINHKRRIELPQYMHLRKPERRTLPALIEVALPVCKLVRIRGAAALQ